MKWTKMLVLALAVFTAAACSASKKQAKAEAKEKKMYDEMAVDMCNCMDGLFDLMDKMEGAEPDDMMAMIGDMQKITESTTACVEGLEDKYPDIDFKSQNNPKAEEALHRNCPKFMELAEKAEGAEE